MRSVIRLAHTVSWNLEDELELLNAIALITGASRGIGRTLAIALAREGATVVCTARTVDGDRGRDLQSAVADIQREGGYALAIACDVTRSEEVNSLITETMDRLGRVDLLINNAGYFPQSSIAAMEPEIWEAAIGINLTGPFLLCRYVLPGMIERKSGNILNITSGAAVRYSRDRIAYSAAKAGLDRLTVNLAEEVREHGIAVNALAPGLVATEMNDFIKEGDRPESVVPAALWLLRQDANTFTGKVVSRREFGDTWP